MKKVFCFGELLLRFSPGSGREWIKHALMPVFIGGAELNVATALTRWHMPVKYATALPGHALSKEIMEELQLSNIDVSSILLQGNRIGTYYLPQGTDLKNEGVIYDRLGSSFSELKPGMIDWELALQDCDWFHFSAISPALNQNIASVCKEALEFASKKGLHISIDLNYRSRLWQYGKDPREIMPELVDYCHLIMGNLWSAETLLGIESPVSTSTDKSNEVLLTAATHSMMQLQQLFPKARRVAYTFRMDHIYWAILKQMDEIVSSRQFFLNEVIDKAGSGDCYMAGLIYGIKNNFNAVDIVNYAASAAVGKLSESGDTTNQTIEQVKSRML